MLRYSYPTSLLIIVFWLAIPYGTSDNHMRQLMETLLINYNKSVRPVRNASDALVVKFGANLCRLIDVDEVNQVLITSLWLEIQWTDDKLRWNPKEWGNITKVHILSNQIWIPDILLYNNADGEPHITIESMAMVDYRGTVIWMPPSIYKSLCPIDIQYFPYDVQECQLKFGGWSHDGRLLDLQPIPPSMNDVIETRKDSRGDEYQYLESGMGLSFYYESAEWDLLSVTSSRYAQIYPGCCGQEYYIDIRYNIIIRRKALFFTVIIVIPCMLIANLTSFVFLIPPREHKLTFSTYVFVALTFYYLILINLIPPTSLVIPLIGKYLLFTLFMVCGSILISVVNVNFYRRRGKVYVMPEWMRWLFVNTLPKYFQLKMLDKRRERSNSIATDIVLNTENKDDPLSGSKSDLIKALEKTNLNRRQSSETYSSSSRKNTSSSGSVPPRERMRLLSLVEVQGVHRRLLSIHTKGHIDLIQEMAADVAVIAANFHNREMEEKITDEWRLMSLVVDRIFLIIYFILNIAAILMFILRSQTLFDDRQPLTRPIPQKPLSGDAINVFTINS